MKIESKEKSLKIFLSSAFGIIVIIGTILGLTTDFLTIFDRFFVKEKAPEENIKIGEPITSFLFTNTFPMYVGQSWEYTYAFENEIEGTKVHTFKETVNMVTTSYDEKIHIYRVEQTGDILDIYCGAWDLKQGPRSIWYITNDTQVYVSCDESEVGNIVSELSIENPDYEKNKEINTPEYVLPLIEENLWKAFSDDAFPREDNMYQWYVNKKVPIQVPAGHFEECFRIGLYTLSDATERYICPEIGLVAAEYVHFGSTVNYRIELKLFSNGE